MAQIIPDPLWGGGGGANMAQIIPGPLACHGVLQSLKGIISSSEMNIFPRKLLNIALERTTCIKAIFWPPSEVKI